MFEVALLFLIIALFVVCAFLPIGSNPLLLFKSSQQPGVVNDACADLEATDSEYSPPKQHFLMYLQNEIESALFPRPTDSVLQRHYDALIRAELDNRLAAMPDS